MGARRHIALAVAAAAVLAGCSTSLPRSEATAPVLTVATGLYPLAEMVKLIGQNKVEVYDPVPDGADPFAYVLPARAASGVENAGLVVEVGDGFQPGFHQAATGSRKVVTLSAVADGDPYVWLDPGSLSKAVDVIASAMEAADPQAAPLFRRNTEPLDAQVASLGMDYSSTLSTCPGTVLVTADGAFSGMARHFGRSDVVVGPRPSEEQVGTAARTIVDDEVRAVVREPWVDDGGVRAVASAAHVPVHTLDTLAGVPARGWPKGADYFTLMEQNLSTISSILGCSPETQ